MGQGEHAAKHKELPSEQTTAMVGQGRHLTLGLWEGNGAHYFFVLMIDALLAESTSEGRIYLSLVVKIDHHLDGYNMSYVCDCC